MATHRSRSDESTEREMTVPLRAHLSPMALIEQNTRIAKSDVVITHQTGRIVTFIVSGEPDAVGGVLKAVYHDLKDGNKDADIELRETKEPYIRIHAPTEEGALALVQTAQRLADAHISGDSTEDSVFVEPPNCLTTSYQIDVHVYNTVKCARPELLLVSGMPDENRKLSSERYRHELSESLYGAFEKASSLYTAVIMKVHLGCYLLETYRKGMCTLEQFEAMVKSPRATGRFDTRMGRMPFLHGFSVEAVLRLIRATASPCIPLDNQTQTSAEVVPTYSLECWHDGDRFEAELDIVETKHRSIDGPLRFKMARTKVVTRNAQILSIEVISIGIGRKLDWRLTAVLGDEKVSAPAAVRQYIETGQAIMEGPPYDFRCYPAVRLAQHYALASKLKLVTMKSLYRFGWKRTGYVVQVTINRRWPTIRDMNNSTRMETDFDVAIYADNWDQDSRVQAGETVGKIWGTDLQGLLRDEAGDGISRVQGLIRTILDIRDFFESSGFSP